MKIIKLNGVLFYIISFFAISCSSISNRTNTITVYERLPQGNRNIAVTDIANKTKYGARNLSDSAGEILTTELGRSNNFKIVERERIKEVIDELKIQSTGITDSNTASKVGQILNCDYIITGSVSNFGSKTEGSSFYGLSKKKIQTVVVEVDIRLISVGTAEIVCSAYGKGIAEKEINIPLSGMSEASGGYDETLAGDALRAAMSNSVVTMIDYFKKNKQ